MTNKLAEIRLREDSLFIANSVKQFLASINPAFYIPSFYTEIDARLNFFCAGCQRLDLRARRIRTSGNDEVTLCSYCYDGENNCPLWVSNPDGYVGVPTETEKREDSSFRKSPYNVDHFRRLADLKVNGGLRKGETIEERLQKDCPLLLPGRVWKKAAVSKLWNHGEGALFLPQFTRNCAGVPIRDTLVVNELGELTDQIKDEYLLADLSGNFSTEYIHQCVYKGLSGGGGGGGSTVRGKNVAFRMLYPDKSRDNNWVQPSVLASVSSVGGNYEHIKEKAIKLKKLLCVASMFELFFRHAQCVLKAWSPDGFDIASVDWDSSEEIPIDVKREWLKLAIESLSLCPGRVPNFLDPSGSSSLVGGTEESNRVEDAIASEILANPEIMNDLKFREEKVRLKEMYRKLSVRLSGCINKHTPVH